VGGAAGRRGEGQMSAGAMLHAWVFALVAGTAQGTACRAGHSLPLDSLGDSLQLFGDGFNTSAGRLSMHHNSGLSVTTTCGDHWDPQGFRALQLLGKTVSFTVDLSRVGCNCNLALYLTQPPARSEDGSFAKGDCPWSPYYCDANQVCGSWCPEVDIMEANTHAFQSTPHKCDAPSPTGHYSKCDRAGCSQNTEHMGGNVYGPGPSYRIDTTRPFTVRTTFRGNADSAYPTFTGMITVLQQEGREVIQDHAECGNYLSDLARPMAAGMALRITYWGDRPSNMSWMDSAVCGAERCGGSNAGDAHITDLEVTVPPRVQFPLSFEGTAAGSCPWGWTCMGGAALCGPGSSSLACPPMTGAGTSTYLSAGGDLGTGVAASPVFLLPQGIHRISFRRSGGAGRGSGLFLHRRSDGLLLCSAESTSDTDAFFEDSCNGLAGYDGEAAYISVKDAQRSAWGKVLVDDVRLLDVSGQDLAAGETRLLHGGAECLAQCKGTGYCNWCGSGNACCTGSASDPAECAGLQPSAGLRSECGMPVEQTVMQHVSEDCLPRCGKAGYCGWCGSGNACCRSGWPDSPAECTGATHSVTGYHECVVPASGHMSFPLSFEHGAEGSCPEGWDCQGSARLCRAGSTAGECHIPGLKGQDGQQYLLLGGDETAGAATSPVFLLPAGIDHLDFRRGGGADQGSGLYLHSKLDGRVLCSAESGLDTDSFFQDRCGGLAAHAGEPAYLHLRDGQAGGWGKVFVDDVHLRDAQGADLQAGDLSSPLEAQGMLDAVAEEISDRRPSLKQRLSRIIMKSEAANVEAPRLIATPWGLGMAAAVMAAALATAASALLLPAWRRISGPPRPAGAQGYGQLPTPESVQGAKPLPTSSQELLAP